jgi:GNAT superfamily N-acetyltransferase
MITIRELTITDEPFLWEMLYESLYVPAGQPALPRELVQQPEISRYVEGWGRAGDCGFLALDDDQPIGAAWLRLLVGAKRGYGYYDETTPELAIAILPAYRGQGIGSRLLARLVENARSRDLAICLSVSKDNPARQLYQRLGFATLAESGSSLSMILRST